MTDPRPGPEGLHLDPRLVLQIGALVVGLVVQTAIIFAVGSRYVTKLEARIEATETGVANNSALIAQTRISVYSAGVDAARFDERLKAFDAQLQKFDRVLDRMSVERAAPPRLQP